MSIIKYSSEIKYNINSYVISHNDQQTHSFISHKLTLGQMSASDETVYKQKNTVHRTERYNTVSSSARQRISDAH